VQVETSSAAAKLEQVDCVPQHTSCAEGQQRKSNQHNSHGKLNTDRLNEQDRGQQLEKAAAKRHLQTSDRKYIDLDELIALTADGDDLVNQLDQFIEEQQTRLDRLRRYVNEPLLKSKLTPGLTYGR
jgi:hypothetical protein